MAAALGAGGPGAIVAERKRGGARRPSYGRLWVLIMVLTTVVYCSAQATTAECSWVETELGGIQSWQRMRVAVPDRLGVPYGLCGCVVGAGWLRRALVPEDLHERHAGEQEAGQEAGDDKDLKPL